MTTAATITVLGQWRACLASSTGRRVFAAGGGMLGGGRAKVQLDHDRNVIARKDGIGEAKHFCASHRPHLGLWWRARIWIGRCIDEKKGIVPYRRVRWRDDSNGRMVFVEISETCQGGIGVVLSWILVRLPLADPAHHVTANIVFKKVAAQHTINVKIIRRVPNVVDDAREILRVVGEWKRWNGVGWWTTLIAGRGRREHVRRRNIEICTLCAGHTMPVNANVKYTSHD